MRIVVMDTAVEIWRFLLRSCGLVAILVFGSCTGRAPEYQSLSERFIQTYYVQADPQGARDFTEGPAKDKLNAELSLLEGFPAPTASERPSMSFDILFCELAQSDLAHCHYRLDIQMDVPRVRKGRLTLRKTEGRWLVFQFIEEK